MSNSATQAIRATNNTRRAVPALLASLFGLIILYGVGFSHTEIAHNAAHDTRHSAAFPCH